MSRLLYFATGVATAIPVVWALSWAVWGAPTSRLEYLSLLGSVVLALSAFIGSSKRRLAARIALCGALLVWSFYLPALWGIAKIHFTDQELDLSVLQWSPSASPLIIENPHPFPGYPNFGVSSTEVERIKEAGITGSLKYFGGGTHGSGEKSHVTLIMQRPVTEPIELKEPDATNVIYVQEDVGWKMFPADAPTLKRTIRIGPFSNDPNQNLVMVELATGALQGSGVWWPKPKPDARER